MKKTLAILMSLALALCGMAALAEGQVDAQALRQQALDAGMKLPQPNEGEALYLGVSDVNFTRQTKLFLAFLASPNRRSIRAAVLFGQAIEVPRPGRDPWLINNQLTLVEDVWLPLDLGGPTSLVIDPDQYTAIANLTVDEDCASCTEILSGHFTAADVGADSDGVTATLKGIDTLDTLYTLNTLCNQLGLRSKLCAVNLLSLQYSSI